ncbi:MAG: hypothetical protein HQ475_04370 [SAR202 cluster bacterium]|nr:hypothetical protein [SAR202 cluster bacterium]
MPRTYDESIQVSEINNYFSQNVVSATANPELVGMLDVTLSNGDVLMISNDLKSSFRQTNLAYAEAVFNWIEDQSDGWSVAGYDDITKGGILDQPGIFIEPEIGIDFGLVFTPDIGAEMLTDIINNLDVVGDLGTGIYMDLSFIAVSAGYFDVYSPDVGGVGSGGFSEGSYFGNEHCGGTSGTAMTVNGELVGYNCDVNGDSDKSGETYSVNTDGQDVLIHNDDIDDDGQADGSPGEQIGFDDDNDGDGIPNSDDSYSTGPTDGDDGYVQYDDEGNVVSNYDMDNDGQPAGQDDDNDGDGIPDTEDPDDDNDGVDDQYDEDPKNPYNSDSNEPEEPETDDDDDGDDDDDEDEPVKAKPKKIKGDKKKASKKSDDDDDEDNESDDDSDDDSDEEEPVRRSRIAAALDGNPDAKDSAKAESDDGDGAGTDGEGVLGGMDFGALFQEDVVINLTLKDLAESMDHVSAVELAADLRTFLADIQ